MAKRIAANVKRLRALGAMTPPTCCLEPMTLMYLHMDTLTDEQKAAMTETEEADRLAGAILPPVWSCDKCGHEAEIQDLDWPEPEKEPAAALEEPSKASSEFKYCPHCGKSLSVL